MDTNLRQVGGIEYSADERAFAEKIRGTLGDNVPPLSMAGEVQEFVMK
jgi:aminobenzoyl-glutamate utilization protein B